MTACNDNRHGKIIKGFHRYLERRSGTVMLSGFERVLSPTGSLKYAFVPTLMMSIAGSPVGGFENTPLWAGAAFAIDGQRGYAWEVA